MCCGRARWRSSGRWPGAARGRGVPARAVRRREMWAFASEVISAFGFDWRRGRQDRSVHPFATGIGPDDVRITTRVVEGEPLALLFGAMHETGHALYEQGIDPAFSRTVLGAGARSACTSRRAASMRTSSAAPGRSGRGCIRGCRHASRRNSVAWTSTGSTAASTACGRRSSGSSRTRRPTTCTSCCASSSRWGCSTGDVVADLPESGASACRSTSAWCRHRRRGRPAGHPLVDRRDRLLRHLHDRQCDVGAALGRLGPRAAGDRDDLLRRGDLAPLLAWLREHVHRHGRKYGPQDLARASTGSRSIRSRTCAIWKRSTARSTACDSSGSGLHTATLHSCACGAHHEGTKGTKRTKGATQRHSSLWATTTPDWLGLLERFRTDINDRIDRPLLPEATVLAHSELEIEEVLSGGRTCIEFVPFVLVSFVVSAAGTREQPSVLIVDRMQQLVREGGWSSGAATPAAVHERWFAALRLTAGAGMP
jgi:hypothetical protein